MKSPSVQKRTAVINALLYVVMITANCLSIFLPLNGKSQMQLSAQYPNLITPAGFTFSVWSVIYTLLLGFIVYQFHVLLSRHHADKNRILVISPFFWGVCICNAAWLFAWHYEFTTVSVLIMIVHLWCLVRIHEKLYLAISWQPLASKIWLDIPFSIYLGWICVATIVNITAWLVSKGITLSFLPPEVWTIVMLVAALIIGIFYVFTRNNKFLALTVAWAFYGIISKRSETGETGSHVIVPATEVALGVLLLIVIANTLRRRGNEYGVDMSA